MRRSRVYLRKPTLRDRDAFIRATRASERVHQPWVAAPDDVKAFSKYIARAARDDHECLLVRRHEDDAIVGVFNINSIIRGAFHNGFLGYYALAPFHGHGYMREGLKLVLRHAFTKLKLHRLEANIQPDNAGSIALVIGCGFRLEGYSPRYLKIAGRWRDHERWAITVEDWRARKIKRA